jgi:hypothetical protein
MLLFYGEGSKSFIRLQTEILNKSDDESIFAWEMPKEHDKLYGVRGLLAKQKIGLEEKIGFLVSLGGQVTGLSTFR